MLALVECLHWWSAFNSVGVIKTVITLQGNMTRFLAHLANEPIGIIRGIVSSTPPASVGIEIGTTTTIGRKNGGMTSTTTATGGVAFIGEVSTHI